MSCFSNPTPVKQEIIRWDQFNSTRLNYMSISALQTMMKEHFRAEKMAFWNKLIPKLLAQENEDEWSAAPPDDYDVNTPAPSTGHNTSSYKALSWVFISVSLILFIAFVVCSVKLLQLRKKSKQKTSIFESSAPPVA